MKKLETELREYYAQIRKQISDSAMQKKITDDLRSDVQAYLSENPEADFSDIVARFGTPDEISDYYIASKEPHELKGKRLSPLFFALLAVVFVVVGTTAVLVILQMNEPEPPLPALFTVSQEDSPVASQEVSGPSRPQSADESSEEILTDSYPIVETETCFYLLPESSYQRLMVEDVEGMTAQELMLARNEIYARHGRLFIAEDVKRYFETQDWYEGTIQPEDFIDEQELNEAELRNVQFLLRMEKEAVESSVI